VPDVQGGPIDGLDYLDNARRPYGIQTSTLLAQALAPVVGPHTPPVDTTWQVIRTVTTRTTFPQR